MTLIVFSALRRPGTKKFLLKYLIIHSRTIIAILTTKTINELCWTTVWFTAREKVASRRKFPSSTSSATPKWLNYPYEKERKNKLKEERNKQKGGKKRKKKDERKKKTNEKEVKKERNDGRKKESKEMKKKNKGKK